MSEVTPAADKARVCIVAPVHDWDDVRVFHKEAVSLATAGHEVVLLAQVNARDRADGEQVEKGVRIKPVWAARRPRLARFLSLPLVLVQALMQRATVYHLHNPDTLPLCFLLRALGRRVIYDTHEDFSRRIGIRQWIPAWMRAAVTRLVVLAEALAARVVNGVIVTQPAVASRLSRTTSMVTLIGNPPRVDRDLRRRVEERAKAQPLPQEPDLRLVYLGFVDEARGLLDYVDAVARINERFPVQLWIIGPADRAALARAAERPGWRFTHYHERMPQEEAFAYVVNADVGLAVLRDEADYACSDPNKLYEYMSFAKPFIASDFSAWRARLQDVDAGWFVAPGSVSAIVGALESARDEAVRRRKGEAGVAFVRTYNWERESERLVAFYGEVLG